MIGESILLDMWYPQCLFKETEEWQQKKQHQQDATWFLEILPIFVIILGNLSPVIWPLRLAAIELRGRLGKIFLSFRFSGKLLENSFMA